MKNTFSRLFALAPSLFLFACGSSTPAPADANTTPTSATTESASMAKPADPAAPAAPAAPAMPAEATPASSPCKGAPAITAKDKTACIAECQKLDDTAPAGSRCAPPRAVCVNRCNQMK